MVRETKLHGEKNRLETFKNWPNKWITPQTLAKAGFYYFGKLDYVRCAYCNGELNNWEASDDPLKLHQNRLDNNCPRAKLGPHVTIYGENINYDTIDTIAKQDEFKSFTRRIKTFHNWQNNVKKPIDLAKAGFYYSGVDDQVYCYQCEGGLCQWKAEDDPLEAHAQYYPKCPFILYMTSREPNTAEEVNDTILCKICYANIIEIVPLPCCHFATCENCSVRYSNCQFCREIVQKRIYVSFEFNILSNKTLCKECNLLKVGGVLLPCAHYVLCIKCAEKNNHLCPQCTEPFNGFARVFTQ